MIINASTKIGSIIKHSPEALEAIVSISPSFGKLRNPILRRVMAGRATIAMASKIGGCKVDDFYNKLKPLGFEIDQQTIAESPGTVKKPIPDFMATITADKVISLDVRPVIEQGKDPLSLIVQKVKALQEGQVLKIINSFEPTPLIHLLAKQGFESFVDKIKDEHIETWFYNREVAAPKIPAISSKNTDGWHEMLVRFSRDLKVIDVRHLEMPMPMHTILEALESLPPGKALFVYHKRIPVFLFPELEERKFSYRVKNVSDTEVHLLIFRD